MFFCFSYLFFGGVCFLIFNSVLFLFFLILCAFNSVSFLEAGFFITID